MNVEPTTQAVSRRGALWVVLCVGLLWTAMVAADWWMRFTWYRWQVTLVSKPASEEGPDAPLARRETGEARGGDLTSLLGIPSVARPFEQARPAFLDLSDEYGFRNAPPVTNRWFPIVAVGDSFMVSGATITNMFNTCLSRVSGRDVYCYGWAGRGTLFTVVRFLGDERFAGSPPRVMVWGLLEREIGGAMLSDLVNRLKRIDEQPAAGASREAASFNWSALAPKSIQKSWPSSSMIAQASRKAWNRIRYYVFGQITPDVAIATAPVGGQPVLFYTWSVDAMKWTPDERKPGKVVDTLKFLDTFCAARGIALVVMLIPDKEQVYRELLPPEFNTPESPIPESTLIAIEQGLRREGVHVVNLLGPFRERAGKGELLYWADDTHWNSEGIDLAAQLVWKEISSAGLLDSQ